MLDYTLHQFEEPSAILLQIIETSLLGINSKHKQQTVISSTNTSTNPELTSFPAIETLEKFYLDFKSFKATGANAKTKKSSTKINECLNIKPCFFSLTSTNLNIFIGDARRVSTLALETFSDTSFDYDAFYASFFDLIKLSSDVISDAKFFQEKVSEESEVTLPISFSNKEYVSILYNFAICWSLVNPYVEATAQGTLPVSKQFLCRILNEKYAIYSEEKEETVAASSAPSSSSLVSNEKSYELIQVLRVGFSFIDRPLSDLNSKLPFSLIFGKTISC